MDSPLEQPAPEDPVARVVALARDLAWGAVNNKWDPIVTIDYDLDKWDGGSYSTTYLLKTYRDNKWRNRHPSLNLLVSFGYMTNPEPHRYILTPRAFELLEQPLEPASIFISYSRAESSAFALLLLSRFKEVGTLAFLDMMDLAPGEDWEERLENEVRSRKNFICLIGPTTLDSPYVQQEIQWALDTDGLTTIPVWHNGFRHTPGRYPELDEFLSRNAVVIENENTKAYNNAVIDLLNFFGYAAV